jgi:SAM-dependent methyltransferase
MWDDRYAEPGYAYGTEPNDFLAAVAERLPAGPVLSIAEGQGRNAVFLAGHGHPVTAVDASAVGMQKAAALAAERGLSIETIVTDLADFDPGEGKWAGIVSIFAHTPPEVRIPLHRKLVAALRPGGVLVLEAYTPEQVGRGTGGPPTPERTKTLASLREELAGLEFEIGRELEREVVEGKYHTGLGSVVQVLAHKPGR